MVRVYTRDLAKDNTKSDHKWNRGCYLTSAGSEQCPLAGLREIGNGSYGSLKTEHFSTSVMIMGIERKTMDHRIVVMVVG
jgi:hypothetical protein